MAVLTSQSQDGIILRAAQRQARVLGLPWCAVYLELWEDQKDSRVATRSRALEKMALAERMGAVTFVTKAADYERATQEAFAECGRRDISPRLVIAGAPGPRTTLQMRRALNALQEACKDICEVTLVAPGGEKESRVSWVEKFSMRRLSLASIVIAVAAVAICYLLSKLIVDAVPDAIRPANALLIYLIACAVIAGRFGFIPGLVTTVLSFLTIVLVDLPPMRPFMLDSVRDAITLGLFLIAACIVSFVNSHVHAVAEASETNEWRMQALLQVYKIALHARSRNEALAELHNNLNQFLRAEIAVFMPSFVNASQLLPVWPEKPAVSGSDLQMLERCWADLREGNYSSAFNAQSGWRFEPLTSAAGELGMLAIRVPVGEAVDSDYENYLRTIAELVASILEKIESVDMKEESRVRDEREKLRTSLLSSVSHDLKTPLASIIGALSVHRSMYEKLPEGQRRELTEAALTEAQRLDSFITNILDLAKIESGAVKFKRQWQSPEDMVLRVKKRLRLRLEGHALMITPPAAAVEVEMDAVISEQALANVIDNAIKYTPAGSPIEVRMETGDDAFLLHVRDHGPGIPEEEQERIFDKYTRLQRQDTQIAGTGLGLALARAAMQGQGGDITVKNHPEGGAVFTLCWPQWRVGAAGSTFTGARRELSESIH